MRQTEGDWNEPLSAAIMTLEGGDIVFLRQLDRKDLDDYINDGLRVLRVRFDGTGRRRRTFPDAVGCMMGEFPEGDVDLAGPVRAGIGFRARPPCLRPQ